MEDRRWKQKKKEERSEKREESKRKNIRIRAVIARSDKNLLYQRAVNLISLCSWG